MEQSPRRRWGSISGRSARARAGCIAATLGVLLTVPSCEQEGAGWIRQGTALEVDVPNELRDSKAAPDQTFINMLASFRSVSEPVTIVGIVPLRVSGNVEVGEIRLAPRPDGPRDIAISFGDYPMDPPAARVRGRCRTQELVDASGYEASPGKLIAIAAQMRITDPGGFRVAGFEVVYRLDDDLFHQSIPTARSGVIKEGGISFLDRAEQRCLHRTTPLRG